MRQSISNSAAKMAIDEARRVSIEVHKNINVVGPAARVRSVEHLWNYCESYLDLPIKLLQHPDSVMNHRVQSVYLKLPGQYEIILMKDLNRCWKRFAVCKELFHALLDDPSIRNRDLESHVDQMFALDFSDDDTEPSAENELAAELAAIEYLFPYRERQRLVAAKYEAMAVAQDFLIPRIYVEKYLGTRNMQSLLKLSVDNLPDSDPAEED